MYKSVRVLTFGLLASSLVMLVLVPFFNQQQNSFLNVMAQEYDKYGDSSYSTYQTDDKKYECRTGPFEGFFVGSVEFCKFKFDDTNDNNRDNRTGIQGPQGPPGPTGATGATGPQGPSGTIQVNNTNLYQVLGNVSNEQDNPSIAVCDRGDVVFEGGYSILEHTTGTTFDTFASFPQSSGGQEDNSYLTNLGNFYDDTLTYQSIAFCLDNPPLR